VTLTLTLGLLPLPLDPLPLTPEQAPKGATAALVQKYLGEPYLINNKKFDMRIYIGVTSFDPLR